MAHGLKQRRVRRETLRSASERDAKIKAEPVRAAIQHHVPQRIQHQLAHRAALDGHRVAGADIIDQRAGLVRVVAVVHGVVEAAHRQDRAFQIALAGMIVDHVEKQRDAFGMQRVGHLAQVRHAARRDARLKRHESDGIIAPGVGQMMRQKVALIDPGGNRHQLDGGGADLFEMRDGGGMGDGGERAAQLLGNVRVEF